MKRAVSISLVVVIAALANSAVAAAPTRKTKNNSTQDSQSQATVRDHRTVASSEPVVRDHREKSKPVVRDHRKPTTTTQPTKPSTGPIIRDHRTPIEPVVRDHRTPKGPIIRDHRDPKTPVGPYKPPVGPITPPPVGPIKPPPVGPVKPPVDPATPPTGPVKPPVDPMPPTKPPKHPPHHDDHGHHNGHHGQFPWWKFQGGRGGYPYGQVVSRPVIVVNPVTVPGPAARLELSPGMELTISEADFGSAQGQAGLRLGEVMLSAEVVRWQPGAVVVRLPMAQIARSVSAELLLVRADGTLARELPFDLVPATN
jgi:hypothetical protein